MTNKHNFTINTYTLDFTPYGPGLFTLKNSPVIFSLVPELLYGSLNTAFMYQHFDVYRRRNNVLNNSDIINCLGYSFGVDFWTRQSGDYDILKEITDRGFPFQLPDCQREDVKLLPSNLSITSEIEDLASFATLAPSGDYFKFSDVTQDGVNFSDVSLLLALRLTPASQISVLLKDIAHNRPKLGNYYGKALPAILTLKIMHNNPTVLPATTFLDAATTLPGTNGLRYAITVLHIALRLELP